MKQHALQIALMAIVIVLVAVVFYTQHRHHCVTFMTDDGRPFKVCDCDDEAEWLG